MRCPKEDDACDGFEHFTIGSTVFVSKDESLTQVGQHGASIWVDFQYTCLHTMPPRLWQMKMIGRGGYDVDTRVLALGSIYTGLWSWAKKTCLRCLLCLLVYISDRAEKLAGIVLDSGERGAEGHLGGISVGKDPAARKEAGE